MYGTGGGSGWIFLLIIACILIPLIPAIMNWVKTHHCPRCGGWFCLRFVRFDVTDKTIGHNKTRRGGGYRNSLFRGGFFGGTNRTNDDPFIREWGKARYLCTKCNLHLTIEMRRDR